MKNCENLEAVLFERVFAITAYIVNLAVILAVNFLSQSSFSKIRPGFTLHTIPIIMNLFCFLMTHVTTRMSLPITACTSSIVSV